MTESMPICSSTAPRRGPLRRRRPRRRGLRRWARGVAVVEIDGARRRRRRRRRGLRVRGACVTGGYELRPWQPSDPNVAAFVRGGAGERCWLRTGDRGLLEPGGAGAAPPPRGAIKEIVNRGGEKISPWPSRTCCCGTRPCARSRVPGRRDAARRGRRRLVVLEAGRQSTHEALRHWCVAGVGDALALDDKWAPALTVFSLRVPKGPDGQAARIKLAQRLGVEALDQLRAATPVSFDVGPDAFLDAATPVSLRSSAPAFFAARRPRPKSGRGLVAEAVDDSMALFAKGAGRGAAEAVGGGHAGPRLLRGHARHPPHARVPAARPYSVAAPANWAGMRQLRANIGAGYGIALFFAVAGAGDARNFERHGRRERQTARGRC
ncbi:ligase [Aureococcus anophagefferens]|uniref:Ligase n=1 Tax=Aureococcus anophagefferens TaxID=44056 RepID=A0ABR1G9T8_AURAN